MKCAIQVSPRHSTFVALFLIASLFCVGASIQFILAQVEKPKAQLPEIESSSDFKSELSSHLPTQANAEMPWFNLADWMYLLNHSNQYSPEGALAHVVASILTRDTGAMASKDAGSLSRNYGLDPWLTENGKQNKQKLASLDTSSTWSNTLTVDRSKSSANGNRYTYWLKGTARTSKAGVFYPIELSIQLAKNDQGRWLAEDFKVNPQSWERR
ncbi:MAG: hypothetical protein AB1589_39045 [Cyanobacteriota bacterium]